MFYKTKSGTDGSESKFVTWCIKKGTCKGKCLHCKEVVSLSSLFIWPFCVDCIVFLYGPDGTFCAHYVLKLTLCLYCDPIDSRIMVGLDGVMIVSVL